VPYPRYGESIDAALAAVAGVRGAIEAGAGRAELLELLAPGAARNAVDCALWDLEARLSGPRRRGDAGAAPPGRIASALTIGIDTPDAMAAEAARLAGAPLIKVKVDAEDPAARIRAVRRGAPGAALIVDPNESWDRALMEAMQDVLREAGVALIEQPVPAGEDAWLEGFAPAVPICADEAVHVAADLDVVARRYQVVNVKLDKAGGLTAAMELAHAARARGPGLMTGVHDQLVAVDRAGAARRGDVDFADLDGPLWLAEDRVGGVRDEGGMMVPPVAGFWG
jgi:L-alanine-DL-glutamate epimerase-like enolase superfamily enzyme